MVILGHRAHAETLQACVLLHAFSVDWDYIRLGVTSTVKAVERSCGPMGYSELSGGSVGTDLWDRGVTV